MRNILFNTNELRSDRLTGLGQVSSALFHNLKNFKLKSCSLKRYKFESNFYFNIRRIAWMQFIVPRIIDQLDYDLFFSPITEAPISNKVRSIVMVHDLISIRFSYSYLVKTFYRAYIPAVLKSSALIITNSNCTTNELIRTYKLNPEKIHTMKLGYDSQNIYSEEVNRENFYLILGSHYYHKNIPNILKAINLVNKKDLKFIFAGQFDAVLTPYYINLAKDLQISTLCVWEGWVDIDRKRDLLNKCKGLIMPSLWEGFGIPALEALACGTPVIGSIIGATPEVLGSSGILVDPLNINEIADAIFQIENDSKIIQRINIEGPKRAAMFDWSESVKKLEKVISNI
mgnify:CR=1 FL=1